MTQSNPMQTTENNSSDVHFQRKFWGVIALSVLALFTYSYVLSNLFQLERTIAVYIKMAVYIIAMILSVTSFILAIRRQVDLALTVIFYYLLVALVAGPATTQGRTLYSTFAMLMIGIIMVRWLLPQPSLRRNAVYLVSAFALAWIIDWVNPPWRIVTSAAAVGPIVAVVFAVILGILLLYEASKSIASSLRSQITVWIGVLMVFVAIVTISYSVITSRQAAINAAQNNAQSIAQGEAEKIKVQINPALNTAQALAATLGVVKDPENPVSLTREQANGILRKVAEENPSFLGTWTLWEPNAFDGQDLQYVNTPLHDATGRFIPYWVRAKDEVEGVAIIDYEQPTPGLNDWYFIPRDTKKVTIIPPYLYPIDGVDTLITTVSVPIIEKGQFYGVAGVDYRVDFVQSIVDGVNLYNGAANAVLLTADGTVVAARNQPQLTLQPAKSVFDDFSQIQPQLINGDTFVSVSPDGKYLRVFAPISIVSGANWSFALVIPLSEITAPATSLAVREALINFGVIALALFALWYLTGILVRPISELTSVANAIASGNLDATAKVTAINETGILANAFNLMTSQVRETLSTLEQRVAARTRDLEIVAEVGTATAAILQSNRLLQEVVDLTKERFNLYHSHIYLLDENGENLVLAAGAGEPGRVMVSEGRSIPINREQSLVARAARERKGVTVNDVTQEPDFLPNPLLPDTHSELAVPMIVGGNVIGVFDIQSEQVGRFTDSDINIQTTLASQLATSIQNVRSFEQSQAQAELVSLVNVIGQRIQRASTVEETLQTAIRELGTAIGASRVKINLQSSQDNHS